MMSATKSMNKPNSIEKDQQEQQDGDADAYDAAADDGDDSTSSSSTAEEICWKAANRTSDNGAADGPASDACRRVNSQEFVESTGLLGDVIPHQQRPHRRLSSEREEQEGEGQAVDRATMQKKRSAPGQTHVSEHLTKKSTSTSAEQKRDREKRRRSELNETLDDLSELVFQIDPSLRSGRAEVVGVESATSSSRKNTITNRTELIQCTVRLLRRLHTQDMQKDKVIADLQTGSCSSAGQPPQSSGSTIERGAPSSDRNTTVAATATAQKQQADIPPSGISGSADHFRGGLDPSTFLAAAHQGLLGGMGSIPGAMGQHLSFGPGSVLATANMGGHAYSRDGSGGPPLPTAFMPFVGFPSAGGASAFGQGFYPGAQLHPGLHSAPRHQGNPQIYRSAAAFANQDQSVPMQKTQTHHPSAGPAAGATALLHQRVGHHPHLSTETSVIKELILAGAAKKESPVRSPAGSLTGAADGA